MSLSPHWIGLSAQVPSDRFKAEHHPTSSLVFKANFFFLLLEIPFTCVLAKKKVSLQKRWIIICFDENLIFVSIFHDFFLIVSLFSFQSSRRFRRSLKSKCLEGFRLIRKSLLALKSLLQFFHPPATTNICSIFPKLQVVSKAIYALSSVRLGEFFSIWWMKVSLRLWSVGNYDYLVSFYSHSSICCSRKKSQPALLWSK